jgi:hypothetical protein
LGYPTHPIDPNLFAREAETCAVGKVQVALSEQQYTAIFSSKNTKLQTLAFRAGKNMVSEESFPY